MHPILQVGDVLLSPDILTEHFCCDLDACGGACCIEGDAGAPVTLEEVAELERVLPAVWNDLDPRARKVLNKQGVAYSDIDGDLVTSIVGTKDCCFTCYDEKGICLCATDRAHREGRINWSKPLLPLPNPRAAALQWYCCPQLRPLDSMPPRRYKRS